MHKFIGIDIGTSSTKVGVIDENGELMGLGGREYKFSGPHPWSMEMDANQMWLLVAASIREAIEASGVSPSDIASVGLSVLGEACMPVDRDGVALSPGIHALDSRAGHYKDYVQYWGEKFGAQRLFEITSYPLSFLPSVMRMMWLKDHEPDIFNRAEKYCTFQDFIVWKLTGKPAIDYSMASRTLLFDTVNQEWSDELVEAAGIPRELLSEAHESSAVVGQVNDQAAMQTSLALGTPVVVGGSDQACVSLAVGALQPGVVMNGAGSTEAVGIPTRTPLKSETMLALGQGSQCHIQKDLWLALGFHLTCGHLVRWTRDQLSQWEVEQETETGHDAYDQITARAATSPPGAKGVFVLPHWSGSGTGITPSLNPVSRGTILGLTLATEKADIYRAVFEGMCYELRMILTSFEEAGIAIDELKVSGGGAKSPFWLQLKADITQKKVTVPAVTEASLFGAAMLGATGVGIFNNLDDAVERLCHDKAQYEPSTALADLHDQRYAVYKDIYNAMLPLNERIYGLM